MTTAQTTSTDALKSFMRHFTKGEGFVVLDAEACDISSADVSPTRTSLEGVVLQPIGILVGVAGNVKADLLGGSAPVLPLQAGLHPIPVTKVYSLAHGTTATGIFFLYGALPAAAFT